jgi:CubicO group peptidase (beta-lactamase class C family)
MRCRMGWLLSLLCLVSHAQAQSSPTPAAFRAIDAELGALASGVSSPAVAVAVAHRGRIVWEAGYGFSDAARTIRTTAHTPFAVGSVAKAVTATALMRLAEQGTIQLDRPLYTYLPGEVRVLRGDSARVTPAALATMTAGIPHVSRHYWVDDVQQARSAEALVRDFGFVAFPPGESFFYSNMSFGVIERLIEKVTGKSFAAVVDELLFQPLGMKNSFFASPIETRAYAARLNSSGEPVSGYVFTEPEGGASLVASAHDLVRFGSFHAGKPLAGRSILSAQSLALMHRPVRTEWSYGFGMYTSDYSLIADGAVVGGAGIVKTIPAEELSVAVVTNAVTNNSPTYAFIDRIVDAALSAAGRTPRRGAVPAFFTQAPFVPGATAGEWSGVIELPRGPTAVSLMIAADSTTIALNGQAPTRASALVVDAGMLRFNFNGVLEDPSLTMNSATLHVGNDTISGYVRGPTNPRSGLGYPRFIKLTRLRK